MNEGAVVLGVIGLNVCCIAVGYCLLAAGLRGGRRLTWLSYLPVALLAGTGACGVTLELLVLLGLRANIPTFLGVAGLLAAAGVTASRRLDPDWRRRLTLTRPGTGPVRPRLFESVIATAFCCLAVVLGALVLLGAFRTAPWLDDSWTFWLPKGLFLGDLGLDPRMFTPGLHFAALTHRSYPVFWSITAELAIGFVGHLDLRAVPAELSILTIAFAGSVVRAMSGRVRPALIWFGVALFLLSPEVGHQTQGGGADLVLGTYLALFALCCFGWIVERNLGSLVLAGLFGSVALATKVEALPEFGICAVVLCIAAWRVDRRAWRPLPAAVIGAVMTSVPWFIWAQIRAGKEPTADYGSSLDLTHGLPPTSRLGSAVRALGAQALSPDHWLLIVPLALLLCVVLALRHRKLVWLTPLLMIVLIFAFFCWLFWFDSRPLQVGLNTADYRVFAPMALLASAMLPALLDRVLGPIPRWEIAIAGLTCGGAVGVAIAVAANPVTGSGLPTIASASPVPATAVSGTPIHKWAFPARLATGWTRFDGLTTIVPKSTRAAGHRRPGCVTTLTGESAYAYQLIGPKVTLSPGAYQVLVSAQIGTGGLEVGVLDSSHDSWVSTVNYTAESTRSGRVLMGGAVQIKASTAARVILANLKPGGGSSTWRVCSVRILRS